MSRLKTVKCPQIGCQYHPTIKRGRKSKRAIHSEIANLIIPLSTFQLCPLDIDASEFPNSDMAEKRRGLAKQSQSPQQNYQKCPAGVIFFFAGKTTELDYYTAFAGAGSSPSLFPFDDMMPTALASHHEADEGGEMGIWHHHHRLTSHLDPRDIPLLTVRCWRLESGFKMRKKREKNLPNHNPS